jgi:hypothetical protein
MPPLYEYSGPFGEVEPLSADLVKLIDDYCSAKSPRGANRVLVRFCKVKKVQSKWGDRVGLTLTNYMAAKLQRKRRAKQRRRLWG